MELSIYDVIKRPVISSKSIELYQKAGKLTFEVNKDANKPVIRRAVEKIWNVKVADVRVINSTGKTKTFMKRKFKASDKKKAIVTLQKGYKVEIPGMMEVLNAPAVSTETSNSVESVAKKF